MLTDGGRVGEKTIERTQGSDARENRQERVECHACRNGEDAVLRDILIDPPKNVFPTRWRYLGGGFSTPAAPFIAPIVPSCVAIVMRGPADRVVIDRPNATRNPGRRSGRSIREGSRLATSAASP